MTRFVPVATGAAIGTTSALHAIRLRILNKEKAITAAWEAGHIASSLLCLIGAFVAAIATLPAYIWRRSASELKPAPVPEPVPATSKPMPAPASNPAGELDKDATDELEKLEPEASTPGSKGDKDSTDDLPLAAASSRENNCIHHDSSSTDVASAKSRATLRAGPVVRHPKLLPKAKKRVPPGLGWDVAVGTGAVVFRHGESGFVLAVCFASIGWVRYKRQNGGEQIEWSGGSSSDQNFSSEEKGLLKSVKTRSNDAKPLSAWLKTNGIVDDDKKMRADVGGGWHLSCEKGGEVKLTKGSTVRWLTPTGYMKESDRKSKR